MWFEQLILENYFPNIKTVYQRPTINYEEAIIENEILNEPKEAYLKYMQHLKEIMQEDEFEEEIFGEFHRRHKE